MDLTSDANPPPIPIRPAKAEDYAAITSLWNAAGLPYCGETRDSEEAFGRQLQHFPDLYLVATAANRLVGVVLGTHDHRKGWINRLAVHPKWQRHGLARKLLEACDAAFRAQGIEIVAALIEPANEASCVLFDRAGYRTDVEVRYFRKLSRPDA